MAIESIDPATGEVLERFEEETPAAVRAKVERASEAFATWRESDFGTRAAVLRRAAGLLRAEARTHAETMTREMGKPIRQSFAEVEKSAWGCEFYAEHGEAFLAPEPGESDGSAAWVRFDPIGPVLAVMPWNFPYWQVFRFAAPAIMAGNVGLLKHASNVPQCALAIEEIFRRAGFPEGVFQTLLIETDQVKSVIEDRRVAAVTLTGSNAAGSQVAAAAGKAIKTSVLELGGSDPFIVMPGADLDAAAQTAVKARVVNNGQSCIAAKRFIVAESVADEFERRFVAGMEALVVGDPMDSKTDVGPLATESQLRTIADQVDSSVRAGARILTGGRRLDRPGWYYAPTVLTGITPDSPAYYEEVFGPVALLLQAKGIDDAIRLANDSPFGLGASAWTRNDAEQARFIGEIEAGMVFINAMVASDPRVPFGGVKESGYGRELSHYGIREFVNTKTIWIG
jgi:succinate-semialdehyde dehydrogenase/glutarate-semialdehyde dehydrogenase